MIYSLSGLLESKTPDNAVINCGGVGFFVMIPNSVYAALPNPGESARLYTFLSVKEDAMDLYGFESTIQRDCFRLLTSISGVGPKIGLAMLSTMDPDRIAFCVSTGDYKSFTACSGVGPKLAQRLVLELKDKIGGLPTSGSGEAADSLPITNAVGDAVAALLSLGYSRSEAEAVIAGADPTLTTEALVTAALRKLAKGG